MFSAGLSFKTFGRVSKPSPLSFIPTEVSLSPQPVEDNFVSCCLVKANLVVFRLAKINPPCRNVLFEGYIDGLSIKLMNKELAPRNLTIQCSPQTVVERDMFCRPIYDDDCTDVGFKVIH